MSKYTETVESNLEGTNAFSVGLCPGCETCRKNNGFDSMETFNEAYESGKVPDEGHFTWTECDSCGSILGGDRFAAHWIDLDRAIVHCEVCADCLCYHANGDEPENWEG